MINRFITIYDIYFEIESKINVNSCFLYGYSGSLDPIFLNLINKLKMIILFKNLTINSLTPKDISIFDKS
jgi:hypothetical protein